MAFPSFGGTVLIMTEPTIADVMDQLGRLLARQDVMERRFDHVDARLEILIDSFGAYRRDYLRDHPRHEAS